MLYLLALLPGEDERLVRQVGEMAHNIMVRLIRVEIAEGLRVDIFRQVFHADNIPRVVIEVVINAIGPLFLYRRDLADPRPRQQRLRLTTLLRISILSALSVAFVGPIGFIGLVAPHIARMLFGEDHRFYLPASALIGALVLSLASIASKNLIPGAIIPVGIVTSLVGVPFFLSIILRHRGQV